MKKRNLKIKVNARVRAILSIFAIAVLCLAVYGIFHALGWTDMEREELQALISSAGVAAPLIYILITFLQVTLIPLPGTVTVLAGCYLFGAFHASIYSFIGMMLGASAAFWLGKVIGRPFINWVAGGKEKVDGWLERLRGKETVLLFFMFLFPAFPDDVLCAVAGLSIRFPVFLIMQIISRIASLAGTVILMSGEVIPFEGAGIFILIGIIALGVIALTVCMKNADRINTALDALADKITKAFKGKK